MQLWCISKFQVFFRTWRCDFNVSEWMDVIKRHAVASRCEWKPTKRECSWFGSRVTVRISRHWHVWRWLSDDLFIHFSSVISNCLVFFFFLSQTYTVRTRNTWMPHWFTLSLRLVPRPTAAFGKPSMLLLLMVSPLVIFCFFFFLAVCPGPLVHVAFSDCGQKCLVKCDYLFSLGTMRINDLNPKSWFFFSRCVSRSCPTVLAAAQRPLADF